MTIITGMSNATSPLTAYLAQVARIALPLWGAAAVIALVAKLGGLL